MKGPVLLCLLVFTLSSLGCESGECRQLRDCCAQSGDLEGMGKSCELAAGVSEPDKCESITQTIVMLYEQKGVEVPAVCLTQN